MDWTVPALDRSPRHLTDSGPRSTWLQVPNRAISPTDAEPPAPARVFNSQIWPGHPNPQPARTGDGFLAHEPLAGSTDVRSTDWPLGGYAGTAGSVSLEASDRGVPRVVDRQDEGAAASSAGTQEASMSATTTSPPASYVQWLIESRPPGLTWSRSSPPKPATVGLD
jgi:hypothetical protein